MGGSNTLGSPSTEQVAGRTVDDVAGSLVTPVPAVILPVTHPACVDTEAAATGELLGINYI